jgi:hypothetical protein
MKNTTAKVLLVVMILVIQACNAPASATEQTRPTQIVVIEPPTTLPAETEVVHTAFPVGLPASNSGIAADQDSSRTSADNTAGGGDRFTYGEYERPFNSIAMDKYFPYLDIKQYEILQDDTWIYTTIVLRSRNDDGTLPGQYALEIDNDIDGRGDWLILASAPVSTDWSTANVQVWEDANNDVGGNEPVNADENPGFVDGYETNVFDSGKGSDADTAWARISPDNQNAVQIAVKRALVDDDGKYLAGTWAGTKLDPAMFDFNDKMTQEEAGAAVKSFAYYPIQFLSEMDNACRVAVGTIVSEDNLGVCKVIAPQPGLGSDPSQPGQPSGCTLTEAVCQSQAYCSVDTVKCECVPCG